MEPPIYKAENKLEYLSSDPETMDLYWQRERSLHERANMISSAEQRGIEQGIERGKLEIAKNLLDILDDETISAKTGLPVEEIKKLRK